MKLLHGTAPYISSPFSLSSSLSSAQKSISKMSLYQLQELASRQQEQIECTQRLLVNKEQQLNYLAAQHHHQQQQQQHQQDGQQQFRSSTYLGAGDYDQHLNLFKEKITLQEAKLRKLRLLKDQIQTQRFANSNVCSELETLKLIFKEKERELSVALSKIETLTRQLDDIKKGNIGSFKHSLELENLRQEFLNEEELVFKRNLLYKRKCDMLKVDQRIQDLQARLARKKQLNQQLASQSNSYQQRNGNSDGNHPAAVNRQQQQQQQQPNHFVSNTLLRNPNHKSVPLAATTTAKSNNMSNVATVEPLPRYKLEYDYGGTRFDYGAKKQDPKYQTLPYNTKFGHKFKTLNLIGQQKVEESMNELSKSSSYHHQHQVDCDSFVNENSAKNDLSLMINTKNDSLEERPSPSGSSGSSDRISSSLTSYSYNEKPNFASGDKYKDLKKPATTNGSDSGDGVLFPHRFVPNSSSAAAVAVPSSNDINGLNEGDGEASRCSNAATLPNRTQPGGTTIRPSVPVKPIGTPKEISDSHENESECNELQNEANEYLSKIQQQHQQHTKDEVDRSSMFESQRSSVSEIVNKLNNMSCSEPWEKTKRRPVLLSTNEIERELQKSSDPVAEEKPSSIHESAPTALNEQDIMNNNEKCPALNDDDETARGIGESDDNNVNRKIGPTATKFRRMKGNLKNKDGAKTSNNQMNGGGQKLSLNRRVSFDPLALLLDASLEGELELVKKTANQVADPSACNDEGITALHNATCAGHLEVVKYLVEIGCDVNVPDSDGWTPLHCAASCNNLTMIKFLVKSGACIFATTFPDQETAAEKCEEDIANFDGCSQYLNGIQEKLGVVNNGIVYALYDYESQNEDELSFKEGDLIKVLQKGDDREKEWWWSKIANREGYIPRNLIGLYPKIKPKDQKSETK